MRALVQYVRQHQPLLGAFARLMRLDKPIGIYLLLWPTLWALWIAAQGIPSLGNLLIFNLGVVLMRSAGCVINDLADRKIDLHIKRTQARPLARQELSVRSAWVLFSCLIGASFLLVLCTNLATLWLSVGALGLVVCYPFIKRYSHYPQMVLGAAFSCGILMAFTAQTNTLPAAAWLLYVANMCWTIAYDTYYAMADRPEDLKIGVKSTAILFGRADLAMILLLQSLSLLCLLAAGSAFELGTPYYFSLLVTVGCFGWQFYGARQRQVDECLKAFQRNHWVGLIILLGIVLHYLG